MESGFETKWVCFVSFLSQNILKISPASSYTKSCTHSTAHTKVTLERKRLRVPINQLISKICEFRLNINCHDYNK